MPKRTVPILAVLVSLVLPTSTSADLGRSSDRDVTALPIVQKYLSADAAYWGASPEQVAKQNHCRIYTVEVGETREETRAESPEPGCWQRIGQGVWEEVEEGNLRLGCMVSEHEYGHSVGHPDEETDPSNVMFAEGPPLNAVPGCMAFPLHGTFPKPHDHSVSRSVTVTQGHPIIFRLGVIPTRADVSTEIYIEGHLAFGTACGQLCELAGTKNVLIETVAHKKRAPLTVWALSLVGRHRVTVRLHWTDSAFDSQR